MLTIDTIQYSEATDAVVLPLLTRDLQIIWQSGTVETVPVRRRDQLKVLAMWMTAREDLSWGCLLYTSPSPRDLSTSRMPSSA